MPIDPPSPDVCAAVAGDPDAMSRVWHEHRRWVAAILVARGARLDQLEDLLQDTAVAFVEHLPRLRDVAALRPWLRTVASHCLQSARKRDGRRACVEPLPDGDHHALADPRERSPAADDETHDRCDAVLAILAAMQPAYREPMWLRTVQGLTQQQIADTLGIPVTTVETRLARARRMLRASFADRSAPAVPRRT